jgi:hypothetical protein
MHSQRKPYSEYPFFLPTFFDLLDNEQVNFNNFNEHQKSQINYLLDKRLLSLDNHSNIQIANNLRVLILKDLF